MTALLLYYLTVKKRFRSETMIIKKMALGIYGANCYIVADEESEEAAVVDPGGESENIYKLLNEMGKK